MGEEGTTAATQTAQPANAVPPWGILALWVLGDAALAWLGLWLDLGGVAALWPAGGWLLVAFLRTPRASWWRLALPVAVLHPLPNLLSGRPALVAAGFTVANLLEAALAALLVGWLLAHVKGWSPARRLAAHGAAVALAAALGGAVATATVAAAGGGAGAWLVWIPSVFVGTAVVAPILYELQLDLPALRALPASRRREAALALLLTAALSATLFHSGALAATALLLLPYPLLLWAAVRYPPSVALLTAGVVAAIAIGATLGGVGPLVVLSADPHLRVGWLQAYLVVAMAMTLLVGVESEDRRRAEHALAERERAYALLADHAGDIICLTDPDGRVRFVSPALERLLGSAPAGLLGQPLQTLVHPVDVPRVETLLKVVARGGRPASYQLRARHREGHWVWMEASSRAVEQGPGDGDPVVVSVLRDVGERLELEQRLARAQRLEAVGQMSAGLAHDFNNLLFVAQLAAEGLTGAQGSVGGEQALADLRTAVARGRDIAGQLLQFARGGHGAQRQGDLAACVAQGVALAQRALPRKVKVRFAAPAAPEEATFDEGQLQQVVVNLVLNAADASPVGGLITVALAGVTPLETLDPDPAPVEPPLEPLPCPGASHLALVVDDQGPGVPVQRRQEVFQPFVSTKAPGKGTGLGLAMVRSIADAHGGTAWCTAAPAGGARFVFALPRGRPSAA